MRTSWGAILSIPAANGKMFNIIDNSAIITKTELESVQKVRSVDEYNCYKNIYVAVWQLIESKPKTSMEIVKQQVEDDGPSFIFYLLRDYTDTASQIL